MKRIIIIYMMGCINIYPATIVQGNGTAADNFAFTAPVEAKAYDPSTGTFFVGLGNPVTTATGNFAVSAAERPTFFTAPKFVGIATDASVNNQPIEQLTTAVATETLVVGAVVAQIDPFTTNQISVITANANGAPTVVSPALNDAGGNVTQGINGIVGAPNHIFAYVLGSNPATPVSGISSLAVTDEAALSVQTTNANTGALGQNQAIKLDIGNIELTDPADVNAILLGENTGRPNPLFWDNILQRLYIGFTTMITQAATPTIYRNVVAVRADPDIQSETAKLVLIPITQTSAVDGNNIIAENAANQFLSVQHLGVMHTSTGPSYLIVHGGSIPATGNPDADFLTLNKRVSALPLVDDPDNLATHGTLAAKNSALIDGVFQTPATAPGDLPLPTDLPVQVGGADLNGFISDMVVAGDAVYISLQNPDNVSGAILVSQAQFGSDGSILNWTPWTVAAPANAFPGVDLPNTDQEDKGKVKFFQVDEATGSIWIVEGTSGRLVGITSFQNGTNLPSNTLVFQLNRVLRNGSFSVLNLSSQSLNMNSTNSRYSLFGGADKVVFARTSIINDQGIETPTTDFSTPDNLLVTTLPTNAGPVTSLAYTYRPAGLPQNFFMAGTQSGLYIFAQTDTGQFLDVSTFGALDQPPFTTSSWQLAPAPELQQPIVDVKSLNGVTYVIVQDNEKGYILYSIAHGLNINTAFTSDNLDIIAQTGVGVFEKVSAFLGLAIVSTGPESNPQEAQQLFLATNQGLYHSNALQTDGKLGITSAVDQEEADWQLVEGTQNDLFLGIGTTDAAVQHTVFPFNLISEGACTRNLISQINQISAQGNANGSAPLFGPLNPMDFNVEGGLPAFELPPIISFWTDGTRRFFIFNRQEDPADQTRLAIIPFNAPDVGVDIPTIITQPSLNNTQRFFWVQSTGATGIILAGTESGVVSLQ